MNGNVFDPMFRICSYLWLVHVSRFFVVDRHRKKSINTHCGGLSEISRFIIAEPNYHPLYTHPTYNSINYGSQIAGRNSQFFVCVASKMSYCVAINLKCCLKSNFSGGKWNSSAYLSIPHRKSSAKLHRFINFARETSLQALKWSVM